MLKMKYLFDNRGLARMLLENWHYDEESLTLMDNYRISAGAVYPFRSGGQVRLLRFAPACERDPGRLRTQMDWIKALRAEGYPAMEPVPDRQGRLLVRARTPWGIYWASVFARVPGTALEDTPLTAEVIGRYGQALGRLHALSSRMRPDSRCADWDTMLRWAEGTLSEKNWPAARDEIRLLRDYFSVLPRSPETYGMIHYDFELDNVFYDEATGECPVIDFDDMMIHWFAMDVDQALDSLLAEGQPDCKDPAGHFLAGYRIWHPISDGMLARRPAFRRFANVYGFARIVHCTGQQWEHEPPWMTGLRGHLQVIADRRAVYFGKPL